MPDRPLQSRARSMRLAPTPAERAVWRILRAAPFDALHFRRQVPFAQRYIADFASHRARVIIEIDGGTHDPESQAEQARTAWLAAQGYRMLRFNNSDVAEADIARALIAALAPVLPPPPGERSEPRVGRVGVGVVERGRRLGFQGPHPNPPHPTLRVGGGSSLPPPPR